MLTVSRILPLLDLCHSTSNLPLTRSLHAHLLKLSLTSHTLLSNRLIHLYSLLSTTPTPSLQCFHDLPFKNPYSYNTLLSSLLRFASTHLSHALDLLDLMPRESRNLVSYNTVISSLTHLGKYHDSLRIFEKMLKDRNLGKSVVIDRYTVVGVASACANLGALKTLKQLHGCIVVLGLDMDLIMCNAMIDAYGKNEDPDSARKVFDDMSFRDTISWTSLITAYSWANRLDEALMVFKMNPVRDSVFWTAIISALEKNAKEDMALEFFQRMLEAKVNPTPFTLVSVLGACAKLGLVKRGKETHTFIVRCIGTDPFNSFIHNAIIDLYSKCGDMTSAMNVFERMPERDFISWNSMVTGFSHNGQVRESLSMFEKMIKRGIKPNSVTFLGVLTACSHAGLVSEGRKILNSMESEHNIRPRPEHYSALIDALGRNQQFDEAIELMRERKISISMLGALLGSSHVHGNVEIAEEAARSLFELEPENSARYVLLANIYAAVGKWDEARRVRSEMKGKGLRKDLAISWIEVRGLKHKFIAGDSSHGEIEAIYSMLGFVFDEMRGLRGSMDEQMVAI